MRSHLTPEEFARCFAGSLTSIQDGEILRHARECPECSAELRRFGSAVDGFRAAIRDRVNVQVESPVTVTRRAPPIASGNRKLKWAVAAALVVAGLIPVATLDSRLAPIAQETSSTLSTAAAADAAALLNSINLHLSRDLPAPLEPMMAPLQIDTSTTFGGVQ